MNIVLVGRDEELIRCLNQIPAARDIAVLDIALLQSAQLPLSHADLILLSDREVPLYQVEDVRKIVGPEKKLAYLLSYQADSGPVSEAVIICERYGVDLLPPKRTVEQIIDEIERRYIGSKAGTSGGKVITIVGALAQSGVTSTALSLADLCAKHARVAVLGFNASNPGLLVPYNGAMLNQLYTQIQESRVLKPADLAAAMQPVGGFHYLAGNADLAKKYRYKTEAAHHIIQCARQEFDFVIIDAGASPDNNLCLQAILHADIRILLSTQQPAALSMWKQYKELLQLFYLPGTKLPGFLLLLNRYRSSFGEAGMFARQMELPLLGALPDLKSEGWLCEGERKLLTTVNHSGYQEQMNKLAKELLRRFDLTLREEAARKGWWIWNRQ
ncbi:hypothetical protein DFQ01_110108 [Paenibacillus cellulosilyticus]|uniref:Pilus assembly protein CpaE n=1 Tax=Paenibacillus cellulosilyticus TaxID=375489 RepID=A0A2V2YSN5_9BACL|nr:hypothetical protein [Paenibacillus cellulosilyticus]PWW01218.1 hypothetical protein DFQ01_110108 [Paenibacillus cellulosilyticus]QKS46827.1 hypothetical protein HUB94_20300 [Paenibacillus cellulosilyticus]